MTDGDKARDRAKLVDPMIDPGILNYPDGIPDGKTLFELIPALGEIPSISEWTPEDIIFP